MSEFNYKKYLKEGKLIKENSFNEFEKLNEFNNEEINEAESRKTWAELFAKMTVVELVKLAEKYEITIPEHVKDNPNMAQDAQAFLSQQEITIKAIDEYMENIVEMDKKYF